MKEKLKTLWQKFSAGIFPGDEDEDDWEDFDTRDDYISGADQADTDAKKALPSFSPVYVWVIVAALAVAAAAAYQISSRRHMYTSYKVSAAYPAEDITGTSYARLGNDFLKYGADGVTLVDASNTTLWSSAYTMQTTVFDQCGESALIYEQQGSQVVVADKEGLIGQFQTDLPILKGSVASNGVCALLLKNDADTLIRVYSPDGSTLAEVKPTLEQTGQPVALDLSAGATKLMVSMVKAGLGTVDSSILFYDFSSTSESADKHITGTMTYTGELFADVFFATDKTPVAVSGDRFIIFSGSENPKEKVNVPVSGEIITSVHSEDYVALVRQSDDANNRYELTIWNLRGKQTMDTLFNDSYQDAAFDSGELLLWSEGHMAAYTPKGVKRLSSDFEEKIELFVKTPGFRKYCVLNNSGITRITAE